MLNINDLMTDDDPEAEASACRTFVASAPEGGTVPAREPYGPNRNSDFMAVWTPGTRTKIPNKFHPNAWRSLEDAREAIFVGRAAGYSDADIAAYLRRNYIFE